MFRAAGFFLIVLVFAGCWNQRPADVLVWRSRVPGSSAVVYYADAYYDSISGHFVSGLIFADSTETLSLDYDYRNELTSFVTISAIRDGKVEVVSWAPPSASLPFDTSSTAYTQPVTTESFQVGGADIEFVRYRGRKTGRPCGLKQYEFSRFAEQPDSVIVYDLTWRDLTPIPRRAFSKGNIMATLNDSGFVSKLEIDEFVAGIHPGYRTSGEPYVLSDGPTACTATFWLTPRDAARQRISDSGVFKVFRSCGFKENC